MRRIFAGGEVTCEPVMNCYFVVFRTPVNVSQPIRKNIPDDIDFYKSESLGLTLIRALAKQIDAELTVEWDRGTRYRLLFKK